MTKSILVILIARDLVTLEKRVFLVFLGIVIFTKLVVTCGNYFKMVIMRCFRELSV